MNKFPRINDVLEIIEKTARLEVYNPNFVNELGVELRHLLKLVPTPTYREYCGVIFDEEYWVYNDWHYDSVAQLISQNEELFSDNDFIPLMNLKKNPYVIDNPPSATIQLATEEEPRPEQKVAKSWWADSLKEDYEH